jgi:carboxyl-terminal processing protease
MRRTTVTALLAGMVAGLALGAVLQASSAGAVKAQDSPYYPLTIFSKVLAHVQTSYVEEVDSEELIYGAIKGMVNSLDPHSAYLDPEEYRVLKGDTAGKFGGVGIEVDARFGRLMVISPLPGSPAEEAGVRSGDEIIFIEDVPTYTLTIQDAVKMMRGEPGTPVTIKVRRGESEILEFELVREVIELDSIESELLDADAGVALVRVKVFQKGTYARFRDALDELAARCGGSLDGLIIDLRNNPGGLLDQAVYTADELLDHGVIMTTRGRGGEVTFVEKAHKKGTRERFDVVLVINEYTASAAEVLAGALKDHKRALVVGMPSFGKGSVQTIIKLPDQSGLKLTTALYATPSGRIVQASGIEPDLMVPSLKPELLETEGKPTEKDLVGHIPGDASGTAQVQSPVSVHDNQLYIAYQLLRASMKMGEAVPLQVTD